MGSLELGVKLFASVREAQGSDSVPVTLTEGASVADLLDALAERYPAIARHRAALAVAVNHTIVHTDAFLNRGDEVALIPPVGGG